MLLQVTVKQLVCEQRRISVLGVTSWNSVINTGRVYNDKLFTGKELFHVR